MHIGEPPSRLPESLVEGLMGVDPATIGHFLHEGFLDPGIHALWRPVKVVGSAITIRTNGIDTTALHRAYEFLQPGDVMVIDRTGDLRHAGFGGVTAYAAKLAGVAGVIVDGMVTDIREIEEYELPVFARGLSAMTGKMLGVNGAINVPVSVGGVTVNPGDVVMADDNGVLVMAPDVAINMLTIAQGAESAEAVTKEKLRSGQALTDLTGTRDLYRANVMGIIREIRAGSYGK